jgi:subtilisin family serine protease
MDPTRPRGYAFEGDYPEASYEGHVGELQRLLRKQVDELDRVGTESGDAEVLGILRGRRGNDLNHAQLDLRRRDGRTSLVARGEIVTTASAYALPAVTTALSQAGFKIHAPTKPRSDLVRLRTREQHPLDVERVLYRLGSLGADAWRNWIATMAAVGKGIGGPEPLTGFNFGPQPTAEITGPTVAVIDTGIVGVGRQDGWLDDVERDVDNIDELDRLPTPDEYLDFQAGHGTFVTGIVRRVAPHAEIKVYRAADTDGFATDQDIADAMLAAYADGAQIINLSLGGRTENDQAPPAMQSAVQTICGDDSKVVIVAAAGNYGDETTCWPAAFDKVQAVAGLTAQLQPASWSSRGPHVRFSTVAEGIRSTFVTGRESPVFDREPETFPPDAWAIWSGTSFAAPQISGAIARLCHERGIDARAAAEQLHELGKPIPGLGNALLILEGVG